MRRRADANRPPRALPALTPPDETSYNLALSKKQVENSKREEKVIRKVGKRVKKIAEKNRGCGRQEGESIEDKRCAIGSLCGFGGSRRGGLRG